MMIKTKMPVNVGDQVTLYSEYGLNSNRKALVGVLTVTRSKPSREGGSFALGDVELLTEAPITPQAARRMASEIDGSIETLDVGESLYSLI